LKFGVHGAAPARHFNELLAHVVVVGDVDVLGRLAELDAPAKRLEPMPESVMPSKGAPKRPTGRRDFSEIDLPEESVVLVDAALEGEVPRSGFEGSYQLKWRRGSMVRLKVMRAKYREVVEGVDGEKTHTAERPSEILPRTGVAQRPPIDRPLSKSVTTCPASLRVRAAAAPATPAPMMATVS
jgi:hypothetical protein